MSIFSPLINLIYPNLCLACGENLVTGENYVCTKCLNEIPKTNFHIVKDNEIEKKFWGKVNIEHATSFFKFNKGSKFQHLIHELKYKNQKEIGIVLGKYAGIDLLKSENYKEIDFLIPVPLHPKKEAKRGYNQSEWICKGLSEAMGIPVNIHNLIRTQENETQTKKGVFERFENTQGIFQLANADVFFNKHILLVDDVLTTGSTLEACVSAFAECKNIKISIFTLATA